MQKNSIQKQNMFETYLLSGRKKDMDFEDRIRRILLDRFFAEHQIDRQTECPQGQFIIDIGIQRRQIFGCILRQKRLGMEIRTVSGSILGTHAARHETADPLELEHVQQEIFHDFRFPVHRIPQSHVVGIPGKHAPE